MSFKRICFELKFVSIVCLLLSVATKSGFSWDDHNITTLKLLQVVHRHGDRAITVLYPNDPFSNLTKYWPEGMGELTTKGKYQMYKLGQFIRKEYQQYLGSDFSPREVYVRSSPKSRCLESVSSLLAGAYPPNNDEWKWNNGTESKLGHFWQPIPIYTVPIEDTDEDRLLRTEVFCPKAIQEMNVLENQELVQNSLQKEREFLEDLSKKVGSPILTLLNVQYVHDQLNTEFERGLKWSDFDRWSPEYEQKIFETLLPLTQLLWITEWNGTVVQRTRAGPLIEELTRNMKNFINYPKNSKKVYLYSTHDSILAVLMHALKVFNNRIIPMSSTLFFELHQNSYNNYFVKIYYFNETIDEIDPHLLRLPQCHYLDNCPINKFIELTKKLIPEDWYKECGLSSNSSPFKSSLVLIFVILINNFVKL